MSSKKSKLKLIPGRDHIGVGGGALIVNDRNETLLIRRTPKARNDAGVWSQPGGTLEYGEKVEQMVVREIKEELDITVKLDTLLCYTDQILSSENQHWVAISYLAKLYEGEPKNLEPHKHDQIRWFSFQHLPRKISKPTKDAIRSYLGEESIDREVEIQVSVENIKPLLRVLKQEAKSLYKSRQIDEYFTPPDRNFLKEKPVKEWLRLRQEDGKSSITYKNWYHNAKGQSSHCDEYETQIESADQARKILTALGHRPITKVDKTREAYRYKNYQISIDKVVGLGDFVEVEYKGKSSKHPDEITDEMIAFLKTIDVGIIHRNYLGYPYMLLFPEDVNEEIL